jgi:hypothetical protein
MTAARAWLPAEAANSSSVRAAAEAAVEDWAVAWFATAGPVACGFRASAGSAPSVERGWRSHADAIAIARCPAQSLRLAGLALFAAPEQLVLSEADRDIVDGLADRMCRDLADRLERAFGEQQPATGARGDAADPFGGRGGLLFTVRQAGQATLMEVAVPLDGLVQFRKSSMPAARRAPAALARLADAATATPVELCARLGQAVLPLSDLAALAPGDVLVLDRTVAEGAVLAVAGSRETFAHSLPAERGGMLALILKR